MARLSRRSVLSAGAFAAMAGVASAALAKPIENLTGDDRALIAIGQEAAPLYVIRNELARAWWALPAESADCDHLQNAELHRIAAAMNGPDGQLDELSDQAMELKASSVQALRAKALLLRHDLCVNNTRGGELVFASPTDELAWSLLSDLIGETI